MVQIKIKESKVKLKFNVKCRVLKVQLKIMLIIKDQTRFRRQRNQMFYLCEIWETASTDIAEKLL